MTTLRKTARYEAIVKSRELDTYRDTTDISPTEDTDTPQYVRETKKTFGFRIPFVTFIYSVKKHGIGKKTLLDFLAELMVEFTIIAIVKIAFTILPLFGFHMPH